MPIESRSSLELLYNVSRELTAAIDLRTVLQRVLFLAVTNVSGERGSILVLDSAGNPIDAAIVYAGQVRPHPTMQMIETMEKGLAGWVMRNRHAVLIPNTTLDSRWLRRPDDTMTRSGGKSAICVPLMARDEMVGVLTVVHPVPDFFNIEHLELIQAIADQAGATILNARLYDDTRRQATLMTTLAESAVTVNASLEWNEVLPRILEQTVRALQAESAVFGLVAENNAHVEYRAAAGKELDALLGLKVPLGQGVAGQVAQTGEPVIRTPLNPGELDPIPPEIYKVESVLCAPVHSQGRILGVLEAFNCTKGMFDSMALDSLRILGGMAGTAMHNAQLYERINMAHRRYRDLFEDSIDPILMTDLEGNILEANLQAARVINCEPARLAQMKIDQIHDMNFEKVGGGFSGVTEEEICSYTSTLHTENNQHIPVDVYARRLTIDGVVALQWILRDISERKALEMLQDDLASMIYHDLRSPLSNIISSLDVLQTLIPVEESSSIHTVITVAIRSTERIQRLLSSLLDTRRLEAGQKITSPADISPETLAREAIEAVLPNADSRHQKVRANLAVDLPNVWVDAGMIRRVIINLLENAIKFTPSGGEIEVGAALDGQKVRMWVKDSGVGISPEDQQRIFNKYISLRDGKDAPKGIGLGLAFCRLAVEAHSGKIWVESEPGKGSAFLFTLPVSKEA